MTLTKTSDRALRQPCKRCGKEGAELYWAKDDESGKFVLIDKTPATFAAGKGDIVGDYARHTCQDRSEAPKADSTKDYRHPSQECPCDECTREDDEPTATKKEDEPLTIGDLQKAREEATALEALRKLLGQQVDREEVERIARDIIADMAYPTRTVVVQNNGERVELEETSHFRLATVMKLLAMGKHVFMVGPAGTGKSTIARQAAKGLNLKFYAKSCYPQMPPSALVGYKDAGSNFNETMFTFAWRNGGVFNLDEIDNSHSSTINLLNEAMSNGEMEINNEMVPKSPDFRLAATANTYGRGPDRQYVGRQALDAATLDRFVFVEIDYDEALEAAACHATGASRETVDKVLPYVRKLRKKAEAERMPVVVSPRGSISMCEMLREEFSWDETVEIALRKGIPSDMWQKMNA